MIYRLSRSAEGEQLVELSEQRYATRHCVGPLASPLTDLRVPFRQLQTQVEGIPDSELEFQEQLIQEREGEIEQIEQGISELNQIFKDLGQIVTEQGSMIGTSHPPSSHVVLLHADSFFAPFADNIEQNVFHVQQDTRGAAEQLTEAHASQKRAGRRALCLLMILLVVLSVVFVAVSERVPAYPSCSVSS